MLCTHCGSSDLDEDRTRGDVTCLNCGAVLEENLIVNEVEFQETSSGGAAVIGQFVNSENQSLRKEPRKITEAKAKERIQIICGQLRMNDDVVKSAFEFYRSALFRGMTRGRNVHVVAASCVYLAARFLRMNIMLLDLSDVVRINVYVLGRCFAEIKQKLRINLPEMDPCLYIERFATKLELGDKTREVSNTAMRILQRMKKDWLSTGRRPSGLAASALLVAARMFEFNRTYEDVARIARISQQTARTRLAEFSKTASSSLTIDEFLNVDYEEEHDPPAFTDGIKRANEALNDEENLKLIAEEVKELERRIDLEMEKLREKAQSRGPWAKYAREDGSVPKGIRSLFESDSDDVSITRSRRSSLNFSAVSLNPDDEEEAFAERYALREALEDVVSSECLDSWVEDIHRITHQNVAASLLTDSGSCDEQRLSLASPSSSSANRTAAQRVLAETDRMLETAVMSSESRPITSLPKKTDKEMRGELDLAGIDDDELDREYILTPKEVIIKARSWLQENAEYVLQMKKKEEEKRLRQIEEAKNPPKKRTRRKRATSPMKHSSAPEAIQSIIQQKKLSTKINYDALMKLSQPECTSTPLVENSNDSKAASGSDQLHADQDKPLAVQDSIPPAKRIKIESSDLSSLSPAPPTKSQSSQLTDQKTSSLIKQSNKSAIQATPVMKLTGVVKKDVTEEEEEEEVEDEEEDEEDDMDIDEIARRTQEEAANYEDDLCDYYDDY